MNRPVSLVMNMNIFTLRNTWNHTIEYSHVAQYRHTLHELSRSNHAQLEAMEPLSYNLLGSPDRSVRFSRLICWIGAVTSAGVLQQVPLSDRLSCLGEHLVPVFISVVPLYGPMIIWPVTSLRPTRSQSITLILRLAVVGQPDLHVRIWTSSCTAIAITCGIYVEPSTHNGAWTISWNLAESSVLKTNICRTQREKFNKPRSLNDERALFSTWGKLNSKAKLVNQIC